VRDTVKTGKNLVLDSSLILTVKGDSSWGGSGEAGMRMIRAHQGWAFGGGAPAMPLPLLRVRSGLALTAVRHLVSRISVHRRRRP
jgi:hypothetical protein